MKLPKLNEIANLDNLKKLKDMDAVINKVKSTVDNVTDSLTNSPSEVELDPNASALEQLIAHFEQSVDDLNQMQTRQTVALSQLKKQLEQIKEAAKAVEPATAQEPSPQAETDKTKEADEQANSVQPPAAQQGD